MTSSNKLWLMRVGEAQASVAVFVVITENLGRLIRRPCVILCSGFGDGKGFSSLEGTIWIELSCYSQNFLFTVLIIIQSTSMLCEF